LWLGNWLKYNNITALFICTPLAPRGEVDYVGSKNMNFQVVRVGEQVQEKLRYRCKCDCVWRISML